jgi:transcriptional regulator of heat shock response
LKRSIVYNSTKEEFYSSGLRNIFESIDTNKREDFLSIVCDFEMLPNRLSQELDNITKSDLNVYIGDSPITESELLSVISKKLNSDGDELMLLTVGPKRMNYRKSLCIFEFFDEELN